MANRLTRLSSETIIKPFDCTDADLNDFLFNDAKKYLSQFLSVTYILETDSKTIAFFSLLNDKIIEEDFDSRSQFKKFQKTHLPADKRYRSYPAVKIARLAVDADDQGKGIGRQLLDFINYMFTNNNKTGCKFITVDAYKQSVRFYENLGFKLFTDRDKDLDTRAMYLELKPLN